MVWLTKTERGKNSFAYVKTPYLSLSGFLWAIVNAHGFQFHVDKIRVIEMQSQLMKGKLGSAENLFPLKE